ncbi:MAG: FAH family protein, partial [Pseudomonadaceae bacterium]
MRLIQFENEQGQRQVGVIGEARVSVIKGVATTRELALQAIRNGHGLIAEIERLGVEPGPVYAELIEQRRVLAPLDHTDPAHCLVSGTGLTHLGSASTRDKMHQQVEAQQAEGKLTDTMQMFQWGRAGGRPTAGSEG